MKAVYAVVVTGVYSVNYDADFSSRISPVVPNCIPLTNHKFLFMKQYQLAILNKYNILKNIRMAIFYNPLRNIVFLTNCKLLIIC